MDPKLVFVHPAIRPYRQELFELLGDRYGCRFIFVEDYEDNLALMRTVKLRNWKAYRSCRFLFYSKGFTLRLLKDAVFGDYDVWIGSGLFHISTHLALPFVLLRGKKFILFSEDWWIPDRRKNRMFRPAAKWIARHCSAIVAASNKTKDFFVRLGAKPEKIFVGWNATSDYGQKPVDDKILAELKMKLDPDGRFVILYINRIVPYKGLDVLIRAFPELDKSGKVTLLVVGDGDFRKACEDQAKKMDLKNILFIGSVPPDQAHYYYRLANLFVLPGRLMPNSNVVAEAWGFTVNEALSCGLPVVTTGAVAASEMIKNGQNGLVTEPEDVEALATALRYFYENRERAQEFAEQAKQAAAAATPECQAKAFQKAINYSLYGKD